MQSKTSFFNKSIFWKTVSRFWPVWGAYLAIWLIMLPVIVLTNRYSYYNNADHLREYLLNIGYYGGLIMSAIFAVFSVMAVWSFAYSSRAAHGTACLPIRREGVFGSVTLAGLLPYLAANAVIGLLTLLTELAIGVVDFGATLQCFALTSLPFLLFYGFATLCAQLTGNILVLPAVYAVLNFVCVGAELLARALAGVFVYGMNQDMDAFALKWFSPFVAILMRCGVSDRMHWDGEVYISESPIFHGWSILVIYAAVGIVLLALALLLYRRRKMETAGDVVAIDVLKPVFRWCMAIGCALCLAVLFYVIVWEIRPAYRRDGTVLFLSTMLVMFVGAFMGWFIAEMLIKKSFRVFRSGTRWGGLGICCIILAGLMCACEFDIFGYEKYVPAPEKVESVTLWCQGQTELEEPESIALAAAMHESIIANKAFHESFSDEYYDSRNFCSTTVKLNYILRSGRQVTREYHIHCSTKSPTDYGDVGLVQDVLNCPEAIVDRKETAFPITEDSIYDSGISAVMTAADCAEAAGYASAEEYVLREYCGLSGSELDALDEADRTALIEEAVIRFAVNGWELEKDYAVVTASDLPMPAAAVTEEGILPYPDFDLNEVLFNYEWNFTPRQMAELYETCLVPDVADGTLGRVWIIEDEEYSNTAYTTEIRISARQKLVTADERYYDMETVYEPYSYAHFYTTPTVDSVRTNAWLAEHGVRQYTLAEISSN